ncbi:caspase domain-containing protein [Streptomyces sp. NPDC059479]|uniref:caspase family protein n=1 Tax=Streptomyces sp. NPDC059479 TaxID=3346848 RepID=UPI00367448E2
MADAWCPDGASSRAVLIGTADYQSAELASIPAVRENLTGLRDVLTDPERGLLPAANCRVLGDGLSESGQVDMPAVGAALAAAAQEATDLLLVYYAGHGLLDKEGRLHLSLTGTDPDTVGFSAIPVDLILSLVGRARAKARVLILDCCFSGRAVAAMASPRSVAADQLERSGTYTLTSTTHTALSFAPPEEEHTAFTGALLRALAGPEPLTLDEIHEFVDDELADLGLPRPQRRAVNAAGTLTLVRAPVRTAVKAPEPTVPVAGPVPKGAVFGRPPGKPWVRRFRRLFGRTMILGALPATYFMWVPLKGGPTALLATLALMLPVGFLAFFQTPRPHLTVNAVGLSYSRDPVSGYRTDIPWEDVMIVGLLHRATLTDGDTTTTYKNILLVRLRPGVGPVSLYPLGFGQLKTLGYDVLGTLHDLDADPVLLRDAVLRCAPARYSTNAELLDIDPRLASLSR